MQILITSPSAQDFSYHARAALVTCWHGGTANISVTTICFALQLHQRADGTVVQLRSELQARTKHIQQLQASRDNMIVTANGYKGIADKREFAANQGMYCIYSSSKFPPNQGNSCIQTDLECQNLLQFTPSSTTTQLRQLVNNLITSMQLTLLFCKC